MILGVAGYQDSGKTTLVELIVPAVTQEGFRVATVKHIAHDDLQVDSAGTDTHRHKKAGARLAVAVSDSESVYFHPKAQTLEEILVRIQLLESPDLILVEGFKGSSIPKIVVGAVPHSGEALFHWDGSTEDAERIARQILEQLRAERSLRASVGDEVAQRRQAVTQTAARMQEREARLRAKTADLRRQLHVIKQNAADAGVPEKSPKRFGRRKR